MSAKPKILRPDCGPSPPQHGHLTGSSWLEYYLLYSTAFDMHSSWLHLPNNFGFHCHFWCRAFWVMFQVETAARCLYTRTLMSNSLKHRFRPLFFMKSALKHGRTTAANAPGLPSQDPWARTAHLTTLTKRGFSDCASAVLPDAIVVFIEPTQPCARWTC
jgi:hypothetical protein